MKYSASGSPGNTNRNLHTTGDAELVCASDFGHIEHLGDTIEARASRGGSVVLRGAVTEEVTAGDNGSVYCHGSPELARASLSGLITIVGDPRKVSASDHGSVIVFGTPGEVSASRSGTVTIVTPEDDGLLTGLRISDHGSIRIVSNWGQDSASTSPYLQKHLDKLFPEEERGAQYTELTALLALNRHRYVD